MNQPSRFLPAIIAACMVISATAALSAAEGETAGNGDAWSRIIRHYDGTRTHSEKQGNKDEVKEETYDENGVMIAKRVFRLDSKGRLRYGYIYDGRGTPLGTTQYGYTFDRISEQRVFDAKGRLISRLFPPGSLQLDKFPANQKHSVRFNYNPNDVKAAPTVEATNEQIIIPVDKPMENFVPGMPIGGKTLKTPESPIPQAAAPAAGNGSSGRRPFSFFKEKKNR